MKPSLLSRSLLAAGALAALAIGAVRADEADIRKTLAERYPNLPKVDEIRPAPVSGLWELRFGTELMYSDAKGNYLIQGAIIDTAAKRNLTEERIEKLSAIDFGSLPLKDAIVWKTGSGKRRIAVFADPNCGYCKKFERDLQAVKDLTVYTFLIPILGGDSPEKSKAIWCAKDSTAAWRNWMIEGTSPPRVMGQCDSAALERNLNLSRKHRVNGTPAIVFEDGSRAPGALSPAEIEKRLAAPAKS
ncbi:DsbC family protein [Sphaerotilus microaerophilus]|uniref:Thiol:disulfide interchange protein n=1 Tax=Sphaerotilus microaerophilus TaxID=2914710 RepID=A0ABM7YHU1_9BURK|nr:DsbC family protein [Sphaerotilus sp. FB-5]BDI03778.1 thiol:disulfide interchange protein DsbC [Sphaerotilus sp. FB-5]